MIRNSFYLFQQGGNIEFVAKDFQQLDRGGAEAQVDLSSLSSGNLFRISQHPGEGSHYHMPAVSQCPKPEGPTKSGIFPFERHCMRRCEIGTFVWQFGLKRSSKMPVS